MSTPTDDLVQGCVKYLASCSEVVAVLGAFGDGTPYLFQHDVWTELEGSASTAVVIRRGGSWSGGNPYNRLRFPRLAVDLWADPLRDAAGNISEPGEVHRRLEIVYMVLDDRLHRPTGADQRWGDVRTVGCVRLGEPDIPVAVGDGDGLLRQTVYYAVSQG